MSWYCCCFKSNFLNDLSQNLFVCLTTKKKKKSFFFEMGVLFIYSFVVNSFFFFGLGATFLVSKNASQVNFRPPATSSANLRWLLLFQPPPPETPPGTVHLPTTTPNHPFNDCPCYILTFIFPNNSYTTCFREKRGVLRCGSSLAFFFFTVI